MDNNFNNFDQNNNQQGSLNGQPMNFYQNANMGDSYPSGIQGAFSQARELFQQKVVAYSFLFMVVALGITALGAKIASDVMLEWMVKSPANIVILFVAEIAIVIVSNVAM